MPTDRTGHCAPAESFRRTARYIRPVALSQLRTEQASSGLSARAASGSAARFLTASTSRNPNLWADTIAGRRAGCSTQSSYSSFDIPRNASSSMPGPAPSCQAPTKSPMSSRSASPARHLSMNVAVLTTRSYVRGRPFSQSFPLLHWLRQDGVPANPRLRLRRGARPRCSNGRPRDFSTARTLSGGLSPAGPETPAEDEAPPSSAELSPTRTANQPRAHLLPCVTQPPLPPIIALTDE